MQKLYVCANIRAITELTGDKHLSMDFFSLRMQLNYCLRFLQEVYPDIYYAIKDFFMPGDI